MPDLLAHPTHLHTQTTQGLTIVERDRERDR
jgi:hypothetical protein